MKIMHGIAGAALIAALAGATGCGARSGPAGEVPEPPASGAAAPTHTVEPGSAEDQPRKQAVITVRDFAYDLPAAVAPGATVTVINEGEATHTVTARGDGGFDVVVAGGETVTFTAPEEPGEYPVTCTYHPEMSGTLIVE